eukprot:747340_1
MMHILIQLSCMMHILHASSFFNWYYNYDYDEQDNSDRANLKGDELRKYDRKIAQHFAPYLRFDKENTEFPMDPEIFYNYEMKRDYAQQMNNHKLDTKTNPTYYNVYTCNDATHMVIDYWWFYGWQGECTVAKLNKIPGIRALRQKFKWTSEHNGDWEHVMVDLKINVKKGEDEFVINKVVFNAHGDAYTKTLGGFEINANTHPSVYVGKIQKGSYHNAHTTLAIPCLFWDDMRRKKGGKIFKTENNLRNLETCSDKWCIHFRDNNKAPNNLEWGPLGKNGISTNPVPKRDINKICNVKKCEGHACDDSGMSKFDKFGKKVRGGFHKVGKFFKKGD